MSALSTLDRMGLEQLRFVRSDAKRTSLLTVHDAR